MRCPAPPARDFSFATLVIGLTLLLLPVGFAAKAAMDKTEVPEPLRPWTRWVLKGHEDATCPFLQATPSTAEGEEPPPRQCLWPARLELDLADGGGRFSQEWTVYRDAWVPLPGESGTWPQAVRVDGRPSPVTPVAGQPAVRLTAGRHTVDGRLEWSALPPMLRVPPETAILALSVRGRTVSFPVRDAEGRVWLQRQAGSGNEESHLDITVHRLADDDVPFQLTTRLEMRVSGRSREERLGRALPPGFAPMALTGALPARLDPDGHLIVQVRPGSWLLTVTARHEGPASEIALPSPDGPWSESEVWALHARPAIRRITVEGPPSIDPQQTTLPEEWKSLPAYMLRPRDVLRLVEKQRGDADPAPDQLSLRRTLWLDFDGGGYTMHDAVSGTFSRSWRLEMPPPAVPGRVAIGGADQLITRRDPGAPPGVEIRQGQADIQADSRIDGRPSSLSVPGWDEDFQEVSAELRLPPGWRLAHATGVDTARSTWISSWTLLDLFLVLVSSLAASRLWGMRTGLVVLAALGLTWIEPGAPRWSWVVAVTTAGLARVLPEGRLRGAARVLHQGTIVVLILIAVPFVAGQARLALYPALERPGAVGGVRGASPEGALAAEVRAGGDVVEPESAVPPPPEEGFLSREVEKLPLLGRNYQDVLTVREGIAESISSNLAPDPKAAAQTGPGLPDWSWRRIQLIWRGPVMRDQQMRLFLLPPWLTAGLAWVRVGLVAGLVLMVVRLCLAGLGGMAGASGLGSSRAARLVLLAVLLSSFAPAVSADIPSPELLDALRARLLEAPDCLPDCVAMSRMALEASPAALRLRLEVHAAAAVAVPLPGGAEAWVPSQVLLDGTQARGLVRGPDGTLRLAVTPGTHQVILHGALPDRDAVAIPLPLRPRRVTAQTVGWRIDGIQDDGRVEDAVLLTRSRERAAGGAATGGSGSAAMPPFVRVERLIEFGLRWEVRTRVMRLTPPGTALLLEVPLIAGESVTSTEVQTRDGWARVSLRPDATEAGWVSSLAPSNSMTLTAPSAVPWVEVWRVAAGPVWHVEPEGPAPIHPGPTPAVRLREWRPWPGESLALLVTRPQAIDGRTFTIDSTTLTISPGLRMSDAMLVMVVRASRGGEQAIELPEGALLQSVAIDNQPQPIRQEGNRVVLPVVPGRRTIQVAWRERRGIGILFRAAQVGLGAESVNSTTVFAMPGDRWTLFLGGPRFGPAVLFWPVLAIALLVSVGLGMLRITPLRWWQWFLLSLGLTQVPLWASLIVVAWLLVLGWRRGNPPPDAALFNLLQLILVAWSALALVLLFWAIQHGLLGLPEMQISGNGSSSRTLVWDLDRTGDLLPRPWAVSLPLLAYRLAMLAWSLWLAGAILGWLRWGWECLNAGGLWKAIRRLPPGRVSPTPATPGSPVGPGGSVPAGG